MHIAIVGCGQLSRMLALAGIAMGTKFSFVAEPGEDTRCVEGLGRIVLWRSDEPISALYVSLGHPDFISVEKEQVDVALLDSLQEFCPVHPNPQAFAVCQHRHREKQLLDQLNIPCAKYHYGAPSDAAAAELGLPLVVKSCREGYDGKNQWILRSQDDVQAFGKQASEEHYIVEQMIAFEKEISQVSVRSASGSIAHYPLAENRHERGILKYSIAPARGISENLKSAAQDYISRIMTQLDYVGVLAMECFVLKDALLVNELAPRVHNSGHWTQSGAVVCQFENHIRAISELALGSTENFGVTAMVNLLGTEKPPYELLSAQASLHWYGKAVRPGRKLGHINISGDDYEKLEQEIPTFL